MEDIAEVSRRSIEWLENGRRVMLDELARHLSVTLSRLASDRRSVEAAVTRGAAETWPTEVLGFWIAALRHCGASWDEIGDLLATSRQAAHRRFASWERRYRPHIGAALLRQALPSNRLDSQTRIAHSMSLGPKETDIFATAADSFARETLDILSPPQSD